MLARPMGTVSIEDIRAGIIQQMGRMGRATLHRESR